MLIVWTLWFEQVWACSPFFLVSLAQLFCSAGCNRIVMALMSEKHDNGTVIKSYCVYAAVALLVATGIFWNVRLTEAAKISRNYEELVELQGLKWIQIIELRMSVFTSVKTFFVGQVRSQLMEKEIWKRKSVVCRNACWTSRDQSKTCHLLIRQCNLFLMVNLAELEAIDFCGSSWLILITVYEEYSGCSTCSF